LARRPANDPGQRIGSLVVNYGGPGDPATETLRLAVTDLPQVIKDRFDVVAFDPRGTGASRPIDCVDDATFERLWSEDATPDTPEDLPRYYDGSYSSVDFAQVCIAAQGEWLRQVGTRNVARDLDRVRAALGDRTLTFLGYSYGTVIGAVYAQQFPKRVRALVLDGAVDLSVDAQEERRRNLVGFEHALDTFLAGCAANERCAFHSDGDPRRALEELRFRFEAGLVLEGADGRTAGISELYTTLLAALYQRGYWPTLADALAAARDGDGSYLREITDLYTGRRPDGTYNNFQEAIGIIACDDRFDDRVSFAQYQQTLEQYRRDFPFFGPVLGAFPVGCDPRLPEPPPAEQLGDVRSKKAPPILVIGTTEDPATPYKGAQDMRRRLRGSRLLTFESTEHASYGRGVACIDDAVNAYLIDRVLPPRGTRCASLIS
jgi:pimeloyl-ACP methyl ester carboxylesterase